MTLPSSSLGVAASSYAKLERCSSCGCGQAVGRALSTIVSVPSADAGVAVAVAGGREGGGGEVAVALAAAAVAVAVVTGVA